MGIPIGVVAPHPAANENAQQQDPEIMATIDAVIAELFASGPGFTQDVQSTGSDSASDEETL